MMMASQINQIVNNKNLPNDSLYKFQTKAEGAKNQSAFTSQANSAFTQISGGKEEMVSNGNFDLRFNSHNLVFPKNDKKEDSFERKTKIVTKCEHTSRKHYAKGMCSTCYHKSGRTK